LQDELVAALSNSRLPKAQRLFMETFLTEDELRHITGKRRHRAQIRALAGMGIGYRSS